MRRTGIPFNEKHQCLNTFSHHFGLCQSLFFLKNFCVKSPASRRWSDGWPRVKTISLIWWDNTEEHHVSDHVCKLLPTHLIPIKICYFWVLTISYSPTMENGCLPRHRRTSTQPRLHMSMASEIWRPKDTSGALCEAYKTQKSNSAIMLKPMQPFWDHF